MGEIKPAVVESDFDTEDDPVIEIPGLRGGVELIKKSQIQGLDTLVVRCTICRSQINHLDYHNIKKHRRLKVIVCKDCYGFYGNEEFSCDENGNYNYCTWCGNGGTLFICEVCPNVYCLNCVRRNFGRAEVTAMQKDGWKCFICDPGRIKAKVNYCNLIVNYSRVLSKKKKVESAEPLKVKELISEKWVLEAFTKTESACTKLQNKMNKLKHVEVARSKSLKHIIKKMEEVVSRHKVELSNVMKVLSQQYDSYIKVKQAEEASQSKNGDVSNNKIKSEEPNETITLPSDSDEIKVIDCEEVASNNVTASDTKEVSSKAKIELKSESTEDEVKKDADDKSKFNGVDVKDNSTLKKPKDEKKSGPEEDDIEISAKLNLLNESSDEEINLNKSDAEGKPNSLTVTAEVHSSELQNDSDFESPRKTAKPKPKIHKSSEKKSNTKIPDSDLEIVESSISSLSSDFLSKSDGDSDAPKKTRKLNKKSNSKQAQKKTVEIDYTKDSKLKLPTAVVLDRCDDILDGQTSVKVPQVLLLEDCDKLIKNILKDPKKKKKKPEANCDEEESDKKEVSDKEEKEEVVKKEIKKKVKAPKKRHDSSSSIVFSSDDERSPEEGKELNKLKEKSIPKKDSEEESKKKILESDSDDSDSSEEPSDSEVEKKKSNKKAAKKNSDSSDDFQPRKKKKYDKLLNQKLFSDDESTKKDKKGSNERKKKRKLSSSGEEFKENKNKSSDTATTSSDDSVDKPKSKRRKRIKKPANSSSEHSDDKKADENKKEETPKKGRKDIKKIISKKDLQQETKEAQQAERERKKRIEEKQKMYNMITDTSKDGKEVITKKLVLEVDPVSKEEVVQIHSEIIEKLKPHQVKGVKFMWECTIESLEALKKEKGSGCILAHCMGLGKTFQVITFLHTCLTNPEVNKHIKTAMVICPYNTVLNWSKELEDWLANVDTEPILVHELTLARDNYERLDVLKYWKKDGGIIIVSYDLFRRLAQDKIPKLKKSLREKLHECLLDPGPDIVVCDEGHVLKNEASAISKACSRLKTERRIVLTGTPLQNNLKEYHCMLSFVKPHLLGTAKEFRNRFVNPIMNGQYEDSDDRDVRKMKKRIHILHKLLEGCVQRCDYTALTKFLPPKHEYVISVKLSEVQINMYRYYLENRSNFNPNTKLKGGTLFQDYNILRNICTHPYIIHTGFLRAEKNRERRMETDEDEEGYDDSFIDDEESDEEKKSGSGSGTDEVIRKYKTRNSKKEDVEEVEEEEIVKKKQWYEQFISEEDANKVELSGKLVVLLNILKECETIGDKVIVFSQSLLTLDRIEAILDTAEDSWIEGLDYFRMDGTTSAEYRKQFIDMFNNPDNIRARLFLISTRAGGLGTNLVGANRVVILDASWNPSHDVQAIFRVYRFGQKKPVYIYRLLNQGTMEEKIYDRQVTKLSLSIRVVDEQQIDRHFNSAELSELYNFDPDSQRNRPTPMVPSDRLLAEMLMKYKDLIMTYHEHDSLLQNETETDLTEEERKAAWNEYENEREGRSEYAMSIDEEIAMYCKEPDFDQADYSAPVLADAKEIVDDLLNKTRVRCAGQSVQHMRRSLLTSINLLKGHFQEIHCKTLRMKQEYLAKGSVPSTVNKYLEELSKVINSMKQHQDRLNQLIIDEDRKIQQAAFQQAYHQKLRAQMMSNNIPPAGFRGPSARFPNMVHINMPGQSVPGQPQYNIRGGPNINYAQFVRLANAHAQNGTFPQGAPRVYRYPTTTTPEPVISIPTENQPQTSNIPTSTTSSVVIEEIE